METQKMNKQQLVKKDNIQMLLNEKQLFELRKISRKAFENIDIDQIKNNSKLISLVKKISNEKITLIEKLSKLKGKIEKNKKKELEVILKKKLKNKNPKLDVKLKMMENNKKTIDIVVKKCKYIYDTLLFLGREGHFQTALENELRLEGYHVLSEVTRPYHYKMSNGLIIQMPYNITGREDLVLPNEKTIIELKQTNKITEKEKYQLCRYMHERKNNTDWGEEVTGFLINFGDIDLDIYYGCYSDGKINIVRIHNEKKKFLGDLINMYEL
jgi:hypothetical protein